MHSFVALAGVWLLPLLSHMRSAVARPSGNVGNATRCRNIPGDPGWPSTDAWAKLNATVGGRLIATVPLAQPCREPGFDEQKCLNVRQQWIFPRIHIESPTSFSAPTFFEGTCTPFQAPSQPCPLGNLPVYAISATSADDIAAGVKFAQANDIRLVVKNTGHDFLGRSSGKGALSIWTHNLNTAEPILDYRSAAYNGPAIKLGAGVIGADAQAAAQRVGHRVVAGWCPSVGIAGGYTQGGGHSPLTSLHGLGADNALAWEVVTADGARVVATPERHANLYWALSGGGGGTFAVVVSLTTRLHRDDKPTAGAFFSFNVTTSTGASPSPEVVDTYWDAVDRVHARIPSLVASGASMQVVVFNTSTIVTLAAPGQSEAQARAHLQPVADFLAARGVPHVLHVALSANFYAHVAADPIHAPLPYGQAPWSMLLTTRILSREFFENPPLPPSSSSSNTSSSSSSSTATTADVDATDARRRQEQQRPALTRLYRRLTGAQGDTTALVGTTIAMAPPPSSSSRRRSDGNGSPAQPPVADNAVQPAWRSANALAYLNAYWDWLAPDVDGSRNRAIVARMAREAEPALRALAPQSAPYLNEAFFGAPDLVRDVFGPNLARLRRVKAQYDPHDLFYVYAGVGSDAWRADAEGRLCRA